MELTKLLLELKQLNKSISLFEDRIEEVSESVFDWECTVDEMEQSGDILLTTSIKIMENMERGLNEMLFMLVAMEGIREQVINKINELKGV